MSFARIHTDNFTLYRLVLSMPRLMMSCMLSRRRMMLTAMPMVMMLTTASRTILLLRHFGPPFHHSALAPLAHKVDTTPPASSLCLLLLPLCLLLRLCPLDLCNPLRVSLRKDLGVLRVPRRLPARSKTRKVGRALV